MTTPALAAQVHHRVRSVAALMDRKRVLHLPVVTPSDNLVGLVTYRTILHVIACSQSPNLEVGEIMRPDPVAVSRTLPCLRALEIMHERGLGCLPVVDGRRLVGIVTESDFIAVSARLLEEWLAR